MKIVFVPKKALESITVANKAGYLLISALDFFFFFLNVNTHLYYTGTVVCVRTAAESKGHKIC